MKKINKKVNWLEIVIVLIGIFLLTRSILPTDNYLNSANDLDADTNIARAIIWAGLYLLAGVCLLFRKNQRIAVIKWIKENKVFAIFLLYLSISFIWSRAPFLTIEKIIALLGTIILSLYFLTRYSLEEREKSIKLVLFIGLIISIVFVFLFPNIGMSTEFPGSWQGIYAQKNGLGRIAALSIIFFLFSKGKENPIIKIVAILLGLIALIYSNSMTSLLAFVGAIVGGFIFSLSKKFNPKLRYGLIIPLILIIALFANLIYNNQSEILEKLNRDTTLTGRTEIWTMAWQFIIKKPLLGYGYNTFWNDLEGTANEINNFFIGWRVVHGHSAIVDTLLDGGLIGLILALSIVLIVLKRNLIDPDNKFNIALLIFIIIINLAENTLLRHNDIFLFIWIAILMGTTNVIRHKEEPQRKPRLNRQLEQV